MLYGCFGATVTWEDDLARSWEPYARGCVSSGLGSSVLPMLGVCPNVL